MKDLHRYHIDITALSETRLHDSAALKKHTFYWSGYKTDQNINLHRIDLAVTNSITKTTTATYVNMQVPTDIADTIVPQL